MSNQGFFKVIDNYYQGAAKLVKDCDAYEKECWRRYHNSDADAGIKRKEWMKGLFFHTVKLSAFTLGLPPSFYFSVGQAIVSRDASKVKHFYLEELDEKIEHPPQMIETALFEKFKDIPSALQTQIIQQLDLKSLANFSLIAKEFSHSISQLKKEQLEALLQEKLKKLNRELKDAILKNEMVNSVRENGEKIIIFIDLLVFAVGMIGNLALHVPPAESESASRAIVGAIFYFVNGLITVPIVTALVHTGLEFLLNQFVNYFTVKFGKEYQEPIEKILAIFLAKRCPIEILYTTDTSGYKSLLHKWKQDYQSPGILFIFSPTEDAWMTYSKVRQPSGKSTIIGAKTADFAPDLDLELNSYHQKGATLVKIKLWALLENNPHFQNLSLHKEWRKVPKDFAAILRECETSLRGVLPHHQSLLNGDSDDLKSDRRLGF